MGIPPAYIKNNQRDLKNIRTERRGKERRIRRSKAGATRYPSGIYSRPGTRVILAVRKKNESTILPDRNPKRDRSHGREWKPDDHPRTQSVQQRSLKHRLVIKTERRENRTDIATTNVNLR